MAESLDADAGINEADNHLYQTMHISEVTFNLHPNEQKLTDCNHERCQTLREMNKMFGDALCLHQTSINALLRGFPAFPTFELMKTLTQAFTTLDGAYSFFVHAMSTAHTGIIVHMLNNGFNLQLFWEYYQPKWSVELEAQFSAELCIREHPFVGFSTSMLSHFITTHPKVFLLFYDFGMPADSVVMKHVNTFIHYRKPNEKLLNKFLRIQYSQFYVTLYGVLSERIKSLRSDDSSYFTLVPNDVVCYVIAPIVRNTRGLAAKTRKIKGRPGRTNNFSE